MLHNKPNITNPTKTNYNLSYNAYYPYGMLVSRCNYSNPVYRYGFQAQEKDNEIKGIGNSVNYKFRMHSLSRKIFFILLQGLRSKRIEKILIGSPRVGRFFAVDPLAKKYSFQSPYAFATNNPVRLVDVNGLGVDDIIIKGANNSSFTIKTDLVDASIDLNNYGITKDFGGNNSINLKELTPDAIGVDFNASASLLLGANVGVNILWHTRGEKDSDKYYPEVHTYAGTSKGTNIGAGASVGMFVAWARNGKGGQANSSWVANGLNWTGNFDSESISIGGVTASHFSSKNYWEGIQLSYSPTKWEFGAPDTGFKALKSVLDEPKLRGKIVSGNVSTTSYYMIYGNGSDYLHNGTNISGLHLWNPIDPSDDK